mmetsp:Transcript_14481/g.45720  ORF Transcript_14481/g.45720 Transcript_14481/m.45720 type:complete len:123 (+) Transcript_14481:1032-1400(+)
MMARALPDDGMSGKQSITKIAGGVDSVDRSARWMAGRMLPRRTAIGDSAEALGDSGNHNTMAMCSGKDEVRFGWAWPRVAERQPAVEYTPAALALATSRALRISVSLSCLVFARVEMEQRQQ